MAALTRMVNTILPINLLALKAFFDFIASCSFTVQCKDIFALFHLLNMNIPLCLLFIKRPVLGQRHMKLWEQYLRTGGSPVATTSCRTSLCVLCVRWRARTTHTNLSKRTLCGAAATCTWVLPLQYENAA